VPRRAADEVALPGTVETDRVAAGHQRGQDEALRRAGEVPVPGHLHHVVRRRVVPEHELVARAEGDGGRPGGEVGPKVPGDPRRADGVAGAGRRRREHHSHDGDRGGENARGFATIFLRLCYWTLEESMARRW
jgi:hypothetical protein